MLQGHNALFEDLFNSKWIQFATAEDAFPMDILERDAEYEVRVAVPGACIEDISVTLEKGNLHINASSKEVSKEDKFLLRGLKKFSYKRIIPNIAEYNIKSDTISSTYKDGILSIIMPKEEEEKPKTIEVSIE